jgi:drug/metabolite transporter (DMT)-like permease
VGTQNRTISYLFAIFTVIVWGETFVSTKILIEHGLSPVEIFIYRFAIAYVGLWFFTRQALFCRSWRDELLCIVLGLGGGSMYFLAENTALQITQATDVSLLVSTSPILTAFVLRIFFRSSMRMSRQLIVGSFLALLGVALVIFNGSIVLNLHITGYILSLLAALSWAFYGTALRKLSSAGYSSLFLTRKVFIYGILTALPFALGTPNDAFHFSSLISSPAAVGHLLFLGIVASLLCYVMWNMAIHTLGVVRVTAFIYFIPVFTLLFSAPILHERITWMAIVGMAFTIFGVYWTEKQPDRTRI